MAELSATSLFGSANLKAYYKLEVGALTTDEKAAYALTNTNTVGDTASGQFGGAADFSDANTNKSLRVTDNMGIDGGAITMAGWFKIRTAPSSGASPILIGHSSDTSDVAFYLFYNNNGGTLRLRFMREKVNVGDETADYNVDLGTADWHHLAFTYDGTDIKGYLDGAEVATTTASGNGNFVGVTSGVAIGAHPNLGGNFASTYADDVAIFNAALTPTQILELYNPVSPAPGGFIYMSV